MHDFQHVDVVYLCNLLSGGHIFSDIFNCFICTSTFMCTYLQHLSLHASLILVFCIYNTVT